MANYVNSQWMSLSVLNQVMSQIPEGHDCCTFEEDGSCILFYVMQNFRNHKCMFNAVINRCININNVDKNGESFLHLLRHLNEDSPFVCDYIKTLLDLGADLKLRNKQGKTPFMKALEVQNFTLARYLFNCDPHEFVVHGPFSYETVFHHIIRLPVKYETYSFITLLGTVFTFNRTVVNRACPITNRRPIQDVIKQGFHELLYKLVFNNVKLVFMITGSFYYSAFAHATEKLDGRAFWILYQSLTMTKFDPCARLPIEFFQGHWVYKNTRKPVDENLETRFLDPRESISSKYADFLLILRTFPSTTTAGWSTF